MRSIFYENYGEPCKVLQLRDVPDLPAPAAGGKVIRITRGRSIRVISSASADVSRSGKHGGGRAGWRTTGLQGVGVIEQVGHESKELKPGMRVAFFPAKWAWGEYVIAPAQTP